MTRTSHTTDAKLTPSEITLAAGALALLGIGALIEWRRRKRKIARAPLSLHRSVGILEKLGVLAALLLVLLPCSHARASHAQHTRTELAQGLRDTEVGTETTGDALPACFTLDAAGAADADTHGTLYELPRRFCEIVGMLPGEVAWFLLLAFVGTSAPAVLVVVRFIYDRGYSAGWRSGEDLDDLRASHAHAITRGDEDGRLTRRHAEA